MANMDDWAWAARPTNAAEYDAMMASLDAHLAAQGLQPNQRALHASRLASMALHLDGIPFLGACVERGIPYGQTDLLPRVFDWYDTNYGDRNKLDFSPGSVVIKLQGSLWRIRLPLVFGQADLCANIDLSIGAHQGSIIKRGERRNILLAVVGLTQAFANRLTRADLEHVIARYLDGFAGVMFLHQAQDHALFEQARTDYKHSVDALMDGRTYGKARWDTAQCAEKVFKGLLGRAMHPFPTNAREGHDIILLGNMVNQHLGAALPDGQLRAIQCSPSVRYGEIAVDQAEALAAHVELIRVLRALGDSELEINTRP